jgi:acyl-CoA synthetase (AMP-forming)/AMP-acid ligase II
MQLDSLAGLWENSIEFYPRETAVVWGNERRDYCTLVGRARRLGQFLYRAGARRESRIAMMSMNRTEWCEYYAACELHGFVAMTINFRYAPPEIAYVLDDGAPTVLLFEARYEDTIASLRDRFPGIRQYICIGKSLDWAPSLEEVLAAETEDGPPMRADPDDPAHMIYTSGTTGKPKGVVRSQRAGLALAAACAGPQRMRVGGRMLLTMPMFHIGAQSMASGQHLLGGMVVLHDRFEPTEVARTIQIERIQITHMAPTLVQRFLDEPHIDEFDLSSLETLCYAAAPMPVPLLKKGLARLGPVFLNCYGATECGNVAVMQEHLHRPEGNALEIGRLGSVGRQHLFATLRVLDEQGVQVPRGTVAELCVRSDSLMTGYWNKPAETAEVLRDGWYRTGDLARMDEEGFVFLVDRKKDMIISGGENIYCREVEDALAAHPRIAEAAVIGIPDDKWGETVKAFIVIQPGTTVTDAEIVEFCRDRIAGYKIPRVIEYVGSLPVLPTGKVNKVALRQQHSAAIH